MTHYPRSTRNGGFTLLEVMVALFLTSLIALLAQRILAGVVDSTALLRRSAPAQESPTFGRQWALEACRTAEVGVQGTHGFEGTATLARFDARLLTGDGWVERQQVAIELHDGGATIRGAAFAAVIVDSADQVTLDYLVDGAGEGGWVTGWSSPVSAPVAIRVSWIRNEVPGTLLCPIGARG